MRILIVTQSVDKNNPVLGFFHRWIEEFAINFEFVTVICLEKGEYVLPKNVNVLSLGKESKIKSRKTKIEYALTFWRYIWEERKNYDVVFVHMNQEYVLMGWLIWKLLGKKITMWRNHYFGNFLTRISCILCDKVFCTSKSSYTAKFKKTVIMPVGIDTDLFKPNPDVKKIPDSILFLGRIAPVKKPDILIKALRLLKKGNVEFRAFFYGDALPKDAEYYSSLVQMVNDFDLSEVVTFHKAVNNLKAIDLYNTHEVFVNITEDGSFDKTIIEALSCNCTVATSNQALKNIIQPKHFINNVDEGCVAEKLKLILLNKDYVDNSGRVYVIKQHSLKLLLSKYKEAISTI